MSIPENLIIYAFSPLTSKVCKNCGSCGCNSNYIMSSNLETHHKTSNVVRTSLC